MRFPPKRIPRGPGAERLRPLYHFSARRGWLNDPNGLCFFKGEWHLFFQHNPTGVSWGNMHWGHAVSADLLGWRELPIALAPDRSGTMFSGSAVVLPDGGGGERLALAYTAAGSTSLRSLFSPTTQRLAFSEDGLRFEKFEGNPVLRQLAPLNRDPKIVRAPGGGAGAPGGPASPPRWIMALFLKGERFALFSSPDLVSWAELQELELPGSGECPDFFPLAAPGCGEKWVFMAADGGYYIGDFDGERYAIESGPFAPELGPNFYAPQTFFEPPDGRRIQIGWLRGGEYPGEVFSQQMGIPTELSLAPTPEGLRVARHPVRELDAALGQAEAAELDLGVSPRAAASGEALDLRLELESAGAAEVALDFRGLELTWRPEAGEVELAGRVARCATAQSGGSRRLALRALLDRSSLEVFAADGLAALSACFAPRSGAPDILASARGPARLRVEARPVRATMAGAETR